MQVKGKKDKKMYGNPYRLEGTGMTDYNPKARYKLNLREAVEFAAAGSDALDDLREMIHAAETEVLRLNEIIDKLEDEKGELEEKYSDLEGAKACGCLS